MLTHLLPVEILKLQWFQYSILPHTPCPPKGTDVIYCQINGKSWTLGAMLRRREMRGKYVAFAPSDRWRYSRSWSFSDPHVICFNNCYSSARTAPGRPQVGTICSPQERRDWTQHWEDDGIRISTSVRQKLKKYSFCEYSGYCLQSVMKRKP